MSELVVEPSGHIGGNLHWWRALQRLAPGMKATSSPGLAPLIKVTPDPAAVTLRPEVSHMHASVEKHRPEIVELCRQYGVRNLDVFGSATTDEFDEARSDVDLLVEFSYDVPGMSGLRQYFGFKEDLEKLLGRSVDLVEGELENPYFRQSVEETREPLFTSLS